MSALHLSRPVPLIRIGSTVFRVQIRGQTRQVASAADQPSQGQLAGNPPYSDMPCCEHVLANRWTFHTDPQVSNVQLMINLPVPVVTVDTTPSHRLRRDSFTNPFTRSDFGVI